LTKLLESIEEDLSLSYAVLTEMSTVFDRITYIEEPNVFCSELENLFWRWGPRHREPYC